MAGRRRGTRRRPEGETADGRARADGEVRQGGKGKAWRGKPGLDDIYFGPCGPEVGDGRIFFIFILFFIRFIKNICRYFFLQICHTAAGSFGGKELPPNEPAVRSLAHGTYRRLIRR